MKSQTRPLITRSMTIWTLNTYSRHTAIKQLDLADYHYGTGARARRTIALSLV